MDLHELLTDLVTRVDGGDVAGLRQRLHAGDLNGLRPFLPSATWAALPGKIDAGDLPWLRTAFASANLGAPSGLVVAGTAAAATTAAAAAVVSDRPAGDAAGSVERGRRGVGATAGGTSVLPERVGAAGAVDERAGLAWWKWAVPAVIALGLLAFGLSQCTSDGRTSSTTTVAAGAAVTTDASTASTASASTASAAATTSASTAAAATTAAAPVTTTVPSPPAPTKDILTTATDAGSFSTLVAAIKAAGLADTLAGPGPFTVFAPTDAAFAKLQAGTVDELIAHPDMLKQVLTYHVVPGKVLAADVQAGDVNTVEGATLALTASPLTVNGVKIETADIVTTNGVIHAIDSVLLPPGVTLPPAGRPSTPPPAPAVTSNGIGNVDFVVYFDSDSAVIRPDAADVITEAAARITPGSTVILTGVADPRGNVRSNQELSERRAKAVAAALTDAGADATFTLQARGAEENDVLQDARRVEIDLP